MQMETKQRQACAHNLKWFSYLVQTKKRIKKRNMKQHKTQSNHKSTKETKMHHWVAITTKRSTLHTYYYYKCRN